MPTPAVNCPGVLIPPRQADTCGGAPLPVNLGHVNWAVYKEANVPAAR